MTGYGLQEEEQLRRLWLEVADAFTTPAKEKGGRLRDPEEVFGSSEIKEWGLSLCWTLLRNRSLVEEWLRDENKWEAFCAGIQDWRESHLGRVNSDPDETTRRLYDVCEKHGLIDYLVKEELIVEVRAPVLRGRELQREGAGDLRGQLEEVSRTFGVGA